MVRLLRYCCLWAALWSLVGCGEGAKPAQPNVLGSKVDSTLKVQTAFPNADYKRVVAYAYDGDDGASIVEKGVLSPTVRHEKELSAEQIQRLLGVLNAPQSYGGTGARCFMPHWGIVFYNAANEAVAQVSICFLCNNLVSSPDLEATKLANSAAFSAEARAALESLHKELEFPAK